MKCEWSLILTFLGGVLPVKYVSDIQKRRLNIPQIHVCSHMYLTGHLLKMCGDSGKVTTLVLLIIKMN